MKILLIAPHPFFQERGTPIDVNLVIRVLTGRKNTHVDAVVYNEGSEVDHPNFKFINGDILNLNQLEQAFEDVERVSHQAAVCLRYCQKYPQRAMDINVTGTLNVLNACVHPGRIPLLFS